MPKIALGQSGLSLFLGLVLAGCSAQENARAGVDTACFNRASDKIGGPLQLTAQTGAPFTEDNFRGRQTLVFFGFTYCPDICPNTLYAIGTALNLLPAGIEKPMTALISVDPARDTPDALAAYIASNGFPSDIVGLTGTEDELQAAASRFAASFERVEDASSASGYLVNHTSIIYLMDENWKLATFFTPQTRPEEMAKCIAALDS
ncbi:MAG: SCO family protein [Alphaproteobacteria bacterium]|nr:SCO family protein [Alphaproteobacteria bacterium]